MGRLLTRAVAAALAGAVVGSVALVVALVRQPGVSFEMDRNVPSFAAGFYAHERSGTDTWVWTSRSAQLRLDGVDRRVPWECRVRFRGGRPPDVSQPETRLSVDGMVVATVPTANEFQDVRVDAPAVAGARGLVFGIAVSGVFLPPGDPRELGVLVDRLACAPAAGARAWPAPALVARAAGAAAMLTLAITLAGIGLGWAVLAGAVPGAAQAVALAIGASQFTSYPDVVVSLAMWTGLAVVSLSRAFAWLGGKPLDLAARIALVASAGAVHVKLLGLLHPAKPIVDALYHAHRLEWVLDGRYYFTQVMPDGVEFPYAIALYVFAAPWTWLSLDLVAVLRVVVCVAEALAGGALFLAIARAWGDRATAAAAVVLFHLVPLVFVVVGNANLTNAFGQSAALATVAAAVALPLPAGRLGPFAWLTALATIALLSHVSTFGLTMATLVTMAVLYRVFGGPTLRAPAWAVFAAAMLAAVLAVGMYWGHFADTYRTLARVRAEAPVATVVSAHAASFATRLGGALRLGYVDVGWPLLVFGLVGAWRVVAERRRDRLTLAIAAWTVAYLVFLAVAVLAPVNEGYERYAAEFVGRVDLAVYPGLVALAALGATWLWRAGVSGRLVTAAVGTGAAVVGFQFWIRWLE
jgi:hypothetical protein